MDLPISAFTGMVGLHYGRKKRKGKVGAHLPLEPWAQAQPDADTADVDEDAGDAMAEEEEAGSGEEKNEESQVRVADTVDFIASESLDKSLPATPTSSDGDASSASEIPVVDTESRSAEAYSEPVVECQKELPDVPCKS